MLKSQICKLNLGINVLSVTFLHQPPTCLYFDYKKNHKSFDKKKMKK